MNQEIQFQNRGIQHILEANMKINNINEFITNEKEFSVHDGEFYGFNYDYIHNRITFWINDNGWTPEDYLLEFNNVIGFNMTACDFWGESLRLNAMYSIDKKEDLEILNKLKIEKLNNSYDHGRFQNERESDFFEIEIEFISGDRLRIACEYIELRAFPC